MLNMQVERAVLNMLEYANVAEDQSFETEDFRQIVEGLNAPE
jgi:hypothetical protein